MVTLLFKNFCLNLEFPCISNPLLFAFSNDSSCRGSLRLKFELKVDAITKELIFMVTLEENFLHRNCLRSITVALLVVVVVITVAFGFHCGLVLVIKHNL